MEPENRRAKTISQVAWEEHGNMRNNRKIRMHRGTTEPDKPNKWSMRRGEPHEAMVVRNKQGEARLTVEPRTARTN